MTEYQKKSLYVGDLHPDATESILFSKFAEFGEVASVRLCRDAQTRASLGYGYINFKETADAEKALEGLKFEAINGMSFRVMWAERNPATRRFGPGNVFVRNLEKSIDSEMLYNAFLAFGNILSCKVATNADGTSKGYGFVHFELEESAKNCMNKLNGMLMNNQKVYVGPFLSKVERLAQLKAQPFTNLYVRNFEKSLNDEQLAELFNSFGTIKSSKIMRDRKGNSRGFGFVNFADPSCALQALNEMNGKIMTDNQLLYVARAQKKSERDTELAITHTMRLTTRDSNRENGEANEARQDYPGVNLYLKFLPVEVDDKTLREEFEKYGTVLSVKVMRLANGVSREFGFVSMSTQQEADEALATMNNKIWLGRTIFVALAQKKEERSAMLKAKYAHQQVVRTANGQPVYKNLTSNMLPYGVDPSYFQYSAPTGRLPLALSSQAYQMPSAVPYYFPNQVPTLQPETETSLAGEVSQQTQ